MLYKSTMHSNKSKLSKSILEMKFMKRTKEKVEKEQFQEEGEEYFGNELTERMKKVLDRFITEPSYVFCEKLIEGRLSFQGMNPEIEKLMEAEQNNKCTSLDVKKETDVSDEQMAERYKGFNKNVKREYKYEKLLEKNNDEYKPIPKKQKFLKPQD
ncbi:M-phase phosphoprotein 6-like isoform X1 [Hylaeus volcanicus]|uniref:M-phase phosphoprotein 6-like isoform X1 n=1 Tax=Hylaeus volcanicus TaxID=313075 RepID=UPI0023B7A928|nr:M-phase phosphoprotein 6-like isoform X1 [Hylaeus volcanicus]XP_053989880.1 M-phase phosphoprotein 6-like isoform X1 [Hylaeus volcanicus]